MTGSTKNYFGGFFKIVPKIGFKFWKLMVLEFTNKYILLRKLSKCHIWTRLGASTKKRGRMQNKNLKKQKKSYLGAKFYACHLG